MKIKSWMKIMPSHAKYLQTITARKAAYQIKLSLSMVLRKNFRQHRKDNNFFCQTKNIKLKIQEENIFSLHERIRKI